jgi:gas vesicle protein
VVLVVALVVVALVALPVVVGIAVYGVLTSDVNAVTKVAMLVIGALIYVAVGAAAGFLAGMFISGFEIDTIRRHYEHCLNEVEEDANTIAKFADQENVVRRVATSIKHKIKECKEKA